AAPPPAARLVRPLAHRAGLRAPAREQRERTEHDRLACAGLAGERDEPGPELKLDLVDDREAADPQRLDQRSPQRSFARITSKRLRAGSTSRRVGRLARRTVTRSSVTSSRPTWPSTVRCTVPPRASRTRTWTSQVGGSTSGRCVSVCAEIGVSTSACIVG